MVWINLTGINFYNMFFVFGIIFGLVIAWVLITFLVEFNRMRQEKIRIYRKLCPKCKAMMNEEKLKRIRGY